MTKAMDCIKKCCGEEKKRQRKVRSDKGKKRGGKKGDKSKTHKGDKDYTTKKGDKDYHQGGKDVKKKKTPYSQTSLAKQASAIARKNATKANAKAKGRKKVGKKKRVVIKGKGMKGSASKTHKGDKDYTTKRGDKDYHQGGKDVKKSTKPFTGKKKRKVRSDKGKKRGGKAKPKTSARTSALMKKGKATAGRVRINKERLKNIVFRKRKGKNVKNLPPPSAYFGAEIRPFIAPPQATKRGRRKPKDILDGQFI